MEANQIMFEYKAQETFKAQLVMKSLFWLGLFFSPRKNQQLNHLLQK